jgi:hypothetical protein
VDFPDGPVVPPVLLHPALDTLGEATGLDAARSVPQGLRAGRGVVLAVVDADFDLGHPALGPAGTSDRPVWGLDATTGRWLDDDALARWAATPRDPGGHGTWVASLAAGTRWGAWQGIAPGATLALVTAAAAPDSDAVHEDTALAGVAAVFARAAQSGVPAVVLLSLGSHRGAHDGQSALERGLAALTADGEAPGRVVVTSAGNDGAREVHARAEGRGAEGVVALGLRVGARPASSPEEVLGLSLRIPRDGAVSLRWPDGVQSPWTTAGQRQGWRHPEGGGYASVEVRAEGDGLVAEVLLASGGTTAVGRMGGDYTLRVRGEGTVDAWVFAPGRNPSDADRPVFLPPYATREGTVTLPATSRGVVAVGAWSHRAENPSDPVGDVARLLGPRPRRAGRPASRPRRPRCARPRRPLPRRPRRAHPQPLPRRTRLEPRPARRLRAAEARPPQPSSRARWPSSSNASPSATQHQLVDALAGAARPLPPGTTRPRPGSAQGWGALDLSAALAALQRPSTAPAVAAASGCETAPAYVPWRRPFVLHCALRDAEGSPASGDTARLDVSAGLRVLGTTRAPGRMAWRLVAEAPPGETVRAAVALADGALPVWQSRVALDPATPAGVAATGGCRAGIAGVGRARCGGGYRGSGGAVPGHDVDGDEAARGNREVGVDVHAPEVDGHHVDDGHTLQGLRARRPEPVRDDLRRRHAHCAPEGVVALNGRHPAVPRRHVDVHRQGRIARKQIGRVGEVDAHDGASRGLDAGHHLPRRQRAPAQPSRGRRHEGRALMPCERERIARGAEGGTGQRKLQKHPRESAGLVPQHAARDVEHVGLVPVGGLARWGALRGADDEPPQERPRGIVVLRVEPVEKQPRAAVGGLVAIGPEHGAARLGLKRRHREGVARQVEGAPGQRGAQGGHRRGGMIGLGAVHHGPPQGLGHTTGQRGRVVGTKLRPGRRTIPQRRQLGPLGHDRQRGAVRGEVEVKLGAAAAGAVRGGELHPEA